MWLKMRLYGGQHILHVPEASIYHQRWLSWWTACQLPWRKVNGWLFSREDSDVSWGKLDAPGQNGVFLVVMLTTWWASSLKSPEDLLVFNEAVGDIHWVLGQLLKWHPGPGMSDTPPLPSPVDSQTPVTTANWLVHPAGKCQPKPSYKVRG